MSDSEKVRIKLKINAGEARPAPPVGPALGQRGVNIKAFCDQFNEATKSFEKGTPLTAVIDVNKDKTFSFVTKSPPVSFLLKKAAGLGKGSSLTKRSKSLGSVTTQQCKDIAKTKINDMNARKEDSAIMSIKGTALSMGLDIVD